MGTCLILATGCVHISEQQSIHDLGLAGLWQQLCRVPVQLKQLLISGLQAFSQRL